MRFQRQWWWYEVRKGSRHERTYLSKSEAVRFAKLSHKVRGGNWVVYRISKRGVKRVATFVGVP